MQPLRRGRIVLRRLSNVHGLLRNFNSHRHKEPKDLSWQWSVKKRPELMNCKNINVPKVCPKPSFFPRFKKVFIPADQKNYEKKKPAMSWKEYWSFLLPDHHSNKPPLITCRKLQAQRRKCCEKGSCADDCARVNCCPPPKEWYGQAEIFVIPSSLPPIGEPQHGPEACGPATPSEPKCVLALKAVCCPIPRKTLNMEDYAYKKAFSGVNLCDEIKETPCSFKLKGVCAPQPEDSKSFRLSCGYFSEFKDVECPKAIATKSTSSEMAPLVCKDQQGESEEPKEINVEIKKNVCGRQTFLKPYKYGEKVPEPKKMHTLAFMKQETKPIYTPKQSFHSTTQDQIQSSGANEGSKQQPEAYKSEPNFDGVEISHRLKSENTCQPAKSGVGLLYTLLKPLSGRLRDGLHAPPPACRPEDLYYNHNSQEIDPELSKLAEKTKKNMTYGLSKIPNTKETTTTTLAKELSKIAEERFIKKAKERGVDRKPVSPTKTHYPPSKLTLLKRKKNSTVVSSQATFMTEAMMNVKQAKKKDTKSKKDKKNVICAGCPGIKAAEEEERNPSPKSFLDCKVKPAGRCRGPQRKVFPDEGEPKSPYYKCKQKPYSLCNQPRPVIKKKVRPYKMPCEENTTKRNYHIFSASQPCNKNKSGINKFHSTTCLNDSSTNIPTIYDLLKVRGLNKIGKQAPNHSNDWDSHTSDSYGGSCEEYDSLPDLSKFQPSSDENGIKKMSYPINLWEYPDNKKKSNSNAWSNQEGNKILMGSNRNENINNNATFVKRKPVKNMTKDPVNSVNSAPSKYNMLFNPKLMKNQVVSINKNTNPFTSKPNNHETKFKNLGESKEKNISNSKITEYNFNSENNKQQATTNASAIKEMPSCPITTQNMWVDSLSSSTEHNLPSVTPVPQEMKAWEKQNSHTLLKDNLTNECSTHSMFRPAEESKKVSTKPDNDSQSMFYQEKIMLSGPGNSENQSNINESKQD